MLWVVLWGALLVFMGLVVAAHEGRHGGRGTWRPNISCKCCRGIDSMRPGQPSPWGRRLPAAIVP